MSPQSWIHFMEQLLPGQLIYDQYHLSSLMTSFTFSFSNSFTSLKKYYLVILNPKNYCRNFKIFVLNVISIFLLIHADKDKFD
ncbi:hypothetical protein KFK09_011781 [Dendrobium nobile]|uniref:Uncharacterized protein n=1 Tax=Dendrobium nobile TaxID=94219 RepID=A0A8T3BDU9_DENNO|nr:hypothetical protein KFK09_011781 [Dendrobium nobile]